MKKNLLFMFVILVGLAGCGSSTDETTSDTSTADSSTETANTAAGDNLLTSYEELIYEDTDGDDMLGSDGDTELTKEKATDEKGLGFNFEVYDSNDNGTLDVGETTHVKLMINNTSSKDYTIQQLHIDSQATFFADDSFVNLTTENTGDITYSFDENRLEDEGIADYTLKAGESATYEWDITWTDDEDGRAQKYLSADYEDGKEFIKIEFMAYTGDENTLYFSIGDQNFARA